MVVSSDSMKKATATSQGRRRWLVSDTAGGEATMDVDRGFMQRSVRRGLS
jgi:hypothetical protein